MKNIFKLTFVLIIFIFSSCNKDERPDYEIRKENIVGDWEVRLITPDPSDEQTFPISFNENGTGTSTFGLPFVPFNFEWIYQYDPEKLVIVQSPDQFISSTTCHNITINTSTSQEWDHEFVNSNNETLNLIWELSRP